MSLFGFVLSLWAPLLLWDHRGQGPFQRYVGGLVGGWVDCGNILYAFCGHCVCSPWRPSWGGVPCADTTPAWGIPRCQQVWPTRMGPQQVCEPALFSRRPNLLWAHPSRPVTRVSTEREDGCPRCSSASLHRAEHQLARLCIWSVVRGARTGCDEELHCTACLWCILCNSLCSHAVPA